MLKWVGVDEKVWSAEQSGIMKSFEEEMRKGGLHVRRMMRTGADMWDEDYPAADGVVITAEPEFYETACREGAAAVWYWRDNVVPEHAAWLVQGMEGVDSAYVRLVYHRKHRIPMTAAKGADWILREASEADEEAVMCCYRACPEAFVQKVPENREERRRELQSYAQAMYGFYGYGMWLAFEKHSGRVLGRAGLEHILQEDVAPESRLRQLLDTCFCLQSGYMVLPEFRGRGYGLELLRAVMEYGSRHAGAEWIIALIRPGNEASVRLAERAGLVYLEKTIYQGTPVLVYAGDDRRIINNV